MSDSEGGKKRNLIEKMKKIKRTRKEPGEIVEPSETIVENNLSRTESIDKTAQSLVDGLCRHAEINKLTLLELKSLYSDSQKQIEKNNETIIQLSCDADRYVKDIEILKNQNKKLEAKLEKRKTDCQTMDDCREQAEREYETLKTEFKEKKKEIEELKERNSFLENQRLSLEQDIFKLKGLLQSRCVYTDPVEYANKKGFKVYTQEELDYKIASKAFENAKEVSNLKKMIQELEWDIWVLKNVGTHNPPEKK